MKAPVPAGDAHSARTATRLDLRQWRMQLLNGLMLTIFIIATPYLAIFLLDVSQTMPESIGSIVLGFGAIYLIVAVNTFARRLPFLVRTAFLLTFFYVLALFDILVYGLSSDGRIYSLTMVIIAALLLGVRSAAVIAALTVASLAGLGWLAHGWLQTPLPSEPNPLFWATQLTSQAVHSLVLLVCVAFLLRRLVDALSASRTALQQAEASAQAAQQQSEDLAAQAQLLEATRARLQALVASLETPAVEVAEGVVLAPITGALDPRRAAALTERLLKRVHAARTRLVILDLAGMPDADPASLQALAATRMALQLLGCRVVFTSLSGALARGFVESGAAEGALEFQRSPQRVLEEHFARAGRAGGAEAGVEGPPHRRAR